jgi:2-polyprenyl-3-methyl-5-hydroxy-6-metoxy-1,4-benzoquinol methylase
MTSPCHGAPYLDSEVDGLVEYLHRLYAGVFTEEAIRAHLENHVGYAFAEYTRAVLVARLAPGARVLDVGCGFGSTVITARAAGLDAFGVEVAAFEVDFARQRLARVRPQDDPQDVFRLGDATKLNLPPASLDAVAFWNVLEHIENCDAMLEAAWRFLRPGGIAFAICPNYAADRLEAHYHVPWRAELRHDRDKAAAYLRSLGRDSRYFESSIFCRTNREVLGILKRIGFEPQEIGTGLSMAMRPGNLPTMLRYPRRFLDFHDPARESVVLSALKPAPR